MSLKVLLNQSQIKNSRQELTKLGVSCIDSTFGQFIRKIGLSRKVVVGDMVKSWDVLETLLFLNTQLERHHPILDIGCFSSEILIALHKMGYTNLTGADLNPMLNRMPYQNQIHYAKTNFLHTSFPNNSFKAVTSISVIEHGFDAIALLSEISRILQPNGYFIASFDYWSEKIDTSGIKFFDMDWRIFSKAEVREFISLSENYNLQPVGKLEFECVESPIDCAGKKYTFGWLVLQKLI